MNDFPLNLPKDEFQDLSTHIKTGKLYEISPINLQLYLDKFPLKADTFRMESQIKAQFLSLHLFPTLQHIRDTINQNLHSGSLQKNLITALQKTKHNTDYLQQNLSNLSQVFAIAEKSRHQRVNFGNLKKLLGKVSRNRDIGYIPAERVKTLGRISDQYALRKKVNSLQRETFTIPNKLLPLHLYEHYYKRLQADISLLNKSGYTTQQKKMNTTWHTVVGHGKTSVFEVALHLSRNYSAPFIPGSAVKGITREMGQHTLKQHKSERFKQIFGHSKQQGNAKKGQVIFFGGYPVPNSTKIGLDTMTPHYTAYYRSNQEPRDTEDPTPIFFPVVQNATYLFPIATKQQNEELLEEALTLLTQALKKLGIGGKTAAGYGHFKEHSSH